MCVQPGERHEIVDWTVNMNVKIGFYLGDGSLRNQIDNQQCLAGTFYITAYRLQTRINFVCTESAARITDYTDQQLRVVARVFECDCARGKCACMQPDSREMNCEHLINLGVLNKLQLRAILEELFD